MSHPDLGPAGIWSPHWEILGASECRDLAAELEEMGWGSLWFPETMGRDAVSSAWLLLGATRGITIGSGIASIWARNPVGASAAHHAIEEAFPGRFIMGLGVSHAPMVELVHHESYAKPYSAMVDYLAAMDAATYTAPTGDGARWRVLAALGDRMLSLAATQAAGVHSYLVPPEHTAHAREVLGEGPLLIPEMRAFLGPADAAREKARANFALYLNLPNYSNNLRRLGFDGDDLADGGSDRLIDALVAHGSVEDIAAGVQRHLDAGADHVLVQLLNGGMRRPPLDEWRELAPALVRS